MPWSATPAECRIPQQNVEFYSIGEKKVTNNKPDLKRIVQYVYVQDCMRSKNCLTKESAI
eukprot:scaffold24661_cov132-Cylindrotheca_fusiformis.AAC.5